MTKPLLNPTYSNRPSKPDVPLLTPLQLFELIVNGIANQRGPSVGKDRKPAYRGVHGRKCPVGHLITDRAYLPSWEGIHFTSTPVWEHLVTQGALPQVPGAKCSPLAQRNFDIAYTTRTGIISRFNQLHDWLAVTCKDDADFAEKFEVHAERIATEFNVRRARASA